MIPDRQPRPEAPTPDEGQTLLRAKRLCAVLGDVTRAMVRRGDRRELLGEICRILVETGGFRMAWFGEPDSDGWVVPEAAFGDTRGYLAEIRISALDIPEGGGPTGIAIREQRSVICSAIPDNPAMHPWHLPAVQNGFTSSAAFPVPLPTGGMAALTLYAVEPDYFSADMETLLAEICTTIGDTLLFAADEELRRDADALLARSQIIARMGWWCVDLRTGICLNSHEASRINGLPPQATPWQSFAAIVDPRDQVRCREAWDKAYSNGTLYDVEHRITVGERLAWVHNLAELEYDEAGHPVRAVGMIQDITDRITARNELEASEERFRIIFESTSEGIIVADLQDRSFLMANPAFCTLFGYGEADIRRLTIAALHPPDALPFVQGEFEALAAGDKTVSADIPCLRCDGTLFYANVSASSMLLQGKNCLVGYFTDVTDLKQATDELRESEQKFRTIGNVAHNAFIQIDGEGHIGFWNAAAERIFGYQAEEILGKSLHQILVPQRYRDSYYIARDHFARTGEGAAVNTTQELAALRRSGEEFPVEVSLSSYRCGGQWHALGIVRDISEQKRNEATLLEQAEQLRQEVAERQKVQEKLLLQQRQLEELNTVLEERVAAEVQKNREKELVLIECERLAALGQLAAGVAHEINNPMGFITLNLTVLEQYFHQLVRFDTILREQWQELSPAAQKVMSDGRASLDIDYLLTAGSELIAESLTGAERVAKIVQDLKSFARFDGSVQEPTDLNLCLESALTIVSSELKYVASLRREYGTLPDLSCNPGQLNQVFINLLVNAAQAIDPPGEIVVRSWHDDRFVYASVSDTGGGIPEEIRDRIFEPFFTTKEVGKGTGLGLSISYDIIKKHQGDILVESRIGKGTTFTVVLPQTAEEAS